MTIFSRVFIAAFVRHISSSATQPTPEWGMPRVVVNIIDNDFPAVMVIEPTAKPLSGGGNTDTYQVGLDLSAYTECLHQA